MKSINKFISLFVLLGLCVCTFTACANKPKYVINFVSNGGSEVSQITLQEGEDLVKPENPTKENYKFYDWYSDVYLTKQYNFPDKMPASSFNLYAKWTERDRVLTFDSRGGTIISPITAPALTSLQMPQDPVKESRIFAGWYVDDKLTVPFDNVMPIDDKKVFAKWVNVETTTKIDLSIDFKTSESNAYSVEHNGTETKIVSLSGKDTYSYLGITIKKNLKAYSTFVMEISGTKGEEILLKTQNGGVKAAEAKFIMNGSASQKLVWTVLPENLTNGQAEMNFYIFINPGFTGGGTSLTIKNFDLYRLLDDSETYQSVIHFNSNGGSGVESMFADTDELIEEPADVPTKPGYTFKGWYIDELLETLFEFNKMPDGQTTLYAKWQSNENVKISFDSKGGSVVDAITLPSGADISEAIPDDPIKEGLLFDGWYFDSLCTQKFDWIAMPDEDCQLYARWVVLEETSTIVLPNDFTSEEPYDIVKNADNSVKISIAAGKSSYSMFGTLLSLYSKDYSYFVITFTGTAGMQVLFKCQNGGVEVDEIKITMTGEKQVFYWKVEAESLPDGTEPMNFYMCLDPGKAHDVKPENDIFINVESVKLFKTIAEGEINQNALHFYTNGAEIVKPIYASAMANITLPVPVKDGFVFDGWFVDAECQTAFTQTTMPDITTILYAKWTAITA